MRVWIRLAFAIASLLALSACTLEKSECIPGELTPKTQRLLVDYVEPSSLTDDADAFFAGYSPVNVTDCGKVKVVRFEPQVSYVYKGEQFSMLGSPIKFSIEAETGKISYEWMD